MIRMQPVTFQDLDYLQYVYIKYGFSKRFTETKILKTNKKRIILSLHICPLQNFITLFVILLNFIKCNQRC